MPHPWMDACLPTATCLRTYLSAHVFIEADRFSSLLVSSHLISSHLIRIHAITVRVSTFHSQGRTNNRAQLRGASLSAPTYIIEPGGAAMPAICNLDRSAPWPAVPRAPKSRRPLGGVGWARIYYMLARMCAMAMDVCGMQCAQAPPPLSDPVTQPVSVVVSRNVHNAPWSLPAAHRSPVTGSRHSLPPLPSLPFPPGASIR
ncbi:hypothetical protein F4819DRAFT_471657 [Hypoxylon fuscum]|nr:hypothetical protein F4819DRAFT_471657 [Hypoxylon fuscum]